MAATVIEALRRFLPAHAREHAAARMGEARRRAIWAITHCRTAAMGGHLHACASCGKRGFRVHSCNHRSCPQCGGGATADWVQRELGKRVGAPCFMVTFTLPAELRALFFTPSAKQVYQCFFASASSSLRDTLANPRWLGAAASGFTMVLHTWNQRLLFHPHIHTIVPGAGPVVTVKSAGFLVPQPALRKLFRARLRDAIAALAAEHELPAIDPAVWHLDWGVDIRPFGSGGNAIRYLGRYVCPTAIGDARILSITDTQVRFRYIDRARGGAQKIETLPGTQFVERYLRHVLPRGRRAIRHYGFAHPAGKDRRERIAWHTGRPLLLGAAATPRPSPPRTPACPCCGNIMRRVRRLPPAWGTPRAPEPSPPRARPRRLASA